MDERDRVQPMSLLFKLVAKFFVEEDDKNRFISYPRETPYMLFTYSCEEDEYSNDEENYFTSYWLSNPRNEKIMKITGQKFPKVLSDGCILLGTSRGWAVFMRGRDFTVHISDVFNPWSPKSSHKTIALPALSDHIVPYSEIVMNVSLSTSFPDHDNDYIVCVNFFGSNLSYCMPNRDSEWTNLDIPFSCKTDSHVFYSRKDQMFYLLTTGCAYMAALDLKNNKKPTFFKLQFDNFPLIPQHEREILTICSRSAFIAESSSGERFIVQWYVEPRASWNISRIIETPKRIMVFKLEDEQGSRIVANYTENIGDLCIFIGKNETFCLEASKFPGLRPNSIYYVGWGYGVFDITNRSIRNYDERDFPVMCGEMLFLSPFIH